MHMPSFAEQWSPAAPAKVGEILLYLDTLAANAEFRPPGWPEKCVGWLNHDSSFVHKSALRNTPLPLSDEFKAQLPKLFSDVDCGVQRAVCDLAQKTGDRAWRSTCWMSSPNRSIIGCLTRLEVPPPTSVREAETCRPRRNGCTEPVCRPTR